MRVLHVAEKNDVAKNIAGILSGGSHRRLEGYSKFNKIYEFDGPFMRTPSGVSHRVTSASGHVLNFCFHESYRNWNIVDPIELFDAPVMRKCESESSTLIKKTLEREIRFCNTLVIWTDCDREGEAIGFEIMEICTAVKRNIEVWRAKFSDITQPSIKRAFESLQRLDERLNNSVLVRSELDLRIGAAFTRLQTLKVGRPLSELRNNLLSYGSCQFPTLGFVVGRYKAVSEFRPETFHRISVTHTRDGETCEFTWYRNRLFDHHAAVVLYERVLENPTMTIRRIDVKPKSKFRPQPMNTVMLEKLASKKLRMTAKEALKHAEKLYTEGLISYPRTETTKFPVDLQLKKLVEQQYASNVWGSFARKIIDVWNGPNAHNGNKTDEAHPPIHPTKYADISLNDDKGKIYELVVRHFLACVSENAKGVESVVEATISEEFFSTRGLNILERNYLEVYVYEKWSGKTIPHYSENETFTPTEILLKQGSTSAPNLLTEADLISLMEKHGIGTDATHAEHIEKIKEREYIGVVDGAFLVPGKIGMGLVSGYETMGFEMSRPRLRASLECDLAEICEGRKRHDIVLRDQISVYRALFSQVSQQVHQLRNSLTTYLGA